MRQTRVLRKERGCYAESFRICASSYAPSLAPPQSPTPLRASFGQNRRRGATPRLIPRRQPQVNFSGTILASEDPIPHADRTPPPDREHRDDALRLACATFRRVAGQIPFHKPSITQAEIDAVEAVLRSG